jgi:hypothetical protein
VTRRYGIETRRAGDRVESSCAVTLVDGAGALRGRYESDLDGLRRDLRALLSLPAE